eukprot:gb/GECG01013123.1/.p1 GENE.gb/GECG01013123.1/~~gb/GECG01013123.1/.p1  ORF type:complete len:325 (+),score=27.31 gb/GECG01013123.1/:1-975(+)
MMITIGYLYADPILHEDGSPVQRIDFHLESRKIRQQLQQISPPVGPFAPVRRKERAETIDVRWLEAIATLENMKILLSKGIDILHYSGHGTPQGISFEQGVVEDDSVKQQQQLGVEKIVNTEELRNLLHDTHRPKLVLVSACHSEAVAQVFTDAGIPYVVSVPQDSSVEDISAISFAKCFYERLLRGETVRKAFERAQGIACSPRHQSTFTLLSPSSEPEDSKYGIIFPVQNENVHLRRQPKKKMQRTHPYPVVITKYGSNLMEFATNVLTNHIDLYMAEISYYRNCISQCVMMASMRPLHGASSYMGKVDWENALYATPYIAM